MKTATKTDVVRARIDAKVKRDADSILKRLGVSHSTLINMTYKAVVERAGIPFDVTLPNKETRAAIQEGKTRRNTITSDLSDWRASVHNS